jgi:hypothetical protein
MSKRFTLAEAESLLPKIGQMLREAVSLKSEYQDAEQAVEGLLQRIMLSGGLVVDRERALEERGRRDRVGDRLKGMVERIQETGCVIKDLDMGLVDFPTLFRGEEVYLCWKMDEPGIQYWHGVHEGFAGRKPIDQDFLEHHQGDLAQ